MTEIFQALGTHIQLLTFIMSLVFYQKYNHTPMKILPIYLGLMAFVEIFCYYFYRVNNVWLYNILNIVQLNFYLIIFVQYLKELEKKIVIGLIVGLNLFYLTSLLTGMNDFFGETASFGYVSGMLILIIVLFLMFKQMLEIENMESLMRNLLFWFCFSLLVFNTTSLPLFSISNWGNILGDFRFSIFYILFFALIISHLLLIIGFIWSKKKFTY